MKKVGADLPLPAQQAQGHTSAAKRKRCHLCPRGFDKKVRLTAIGAGTQSVQLTVLNSIELLCILQLVVLIVNNHNKGWGLTRPQLVGFA